MKLTHLEVTNFGSYPKFSINLDSLGLSLLYGKTGSGKSTVMDMSCWVLFGVTAKDGAADDVRAWQTPNEPTTGRQTISSAKGDIVIYRVRGKSNQNDLYFKIDGSDDVKRGKDITETQKLINTYLGFDADTYITSAYFHEFSPTGSFFVDKAKDRRALFEKIASLELPKKLAESASTARKEIKNTLETRSLYHAKQLGSIDSTIKRINDLAGSIENWEKFKLAAIEKSKTDGANFYKEQTARVEALTKAMTDYEIKRNAAIENLIASIEKADIKPDSFFDKELNSLKSHKGHDSKTCKTCGQAVLQTEVIEELENRRRSIERSRTANTLAKSQKENDLRRLEELSGQVNPYIAQIENEQKRTNPYTDQVEREKQRTNPYLNDEKKLKVELAELQDAEYLVRVNIQELKHELASLNTLYDMSSDLRAELLLGAVKGIEKSTNDTLEKYFDSEISVNFELSGDSLDVTLHKSGYECNYKQLSKGQRQLLKLAFVTSVMKASANRVGAHFDTVFFDEALDGLDESLKVKAFNLFQELENDHDTVLLIDHAQAFQNMFTRKFHVTMTGDVSSVEEELE